jgi:hypothetical protein
MLACDRSFRTCGTIAATESALRAGTPLKPPAAFGSGEESLHGR